MAYYRIDKNNNIIDNANFKYADDCLQTEKNIVRGFDGKLVFEEETNTQSYLTAKQEYETNNNNYNRIAELKQLLANSDYKAIKYAEGLISEEEYSNIRAMRQAYRLEINELEEKIKEV